MFSPNQQDQGGANQFELVLNLQHSRKVSTGDAASARSRAQALVADVLRSRLGVETEAVSGNFLRARGFFDVGKALAASRALQLAFEGFRSTAAGARTNISVVLDALSPEEALSRNASPSVEQRELFSLARSSRVLITQALYERAPACQPLALRSFPPRAGVYEFLWTSPERLEQLQSETDFVTEPVAFEPEPFARDMEATVVQRAITNPRLAVVAEPEQPMPVLERQDRQMEQSYGDHSEPAPKRSRFWAIALACTAAVLLAAGGLVFWRPGDAKPPAQPNLAAQTEPAPAPVEAPPPAPLDPPKADPTPVTKPASDSHTKTAPSQASKPTTDSKPAQRPKNVACPSEVIESYLAQAEKNRNRGNLDEAEDEYDRVLSCDSNNRDAKQGKKKLNADRGLN